MKILLISDNHGCALTIPKTIDYDLVIHAGDLVPIRQGVQSLEVMLDKDVTYHNKKFKSWVDTLKAPLVVVPGNHDFIYQNRLSDLEINYNLLINDSFFFKDHVFYGSPYQPIFGDWAFNISTESLKLNWQLIPEDTTFLITHSPPYKILDRVGERHTGCAALRVEAEERPNIKHHVFGHIHDRYGDVHVNGIHYINSAQQMSLYNTRTFELKKLKQLNPLVL